MNLGALRQHHRLSCQTDRPTCGAGARSINRLADTAISPACDPPVKATMFHPYLRGVWPERLAVTMAP